MMDALGPMKGSALCQWPQGAVGRGQLRKSATTGRAGGLRESPYKRDLGRESRAQRSGARARARARARMQAGGNVGHHQ